MKYSIIPKFLFEDEDIIYLKDKGIKIDEGLQPVGKVKVPCYRFYNISEMEVFDEMRSPLNESVEQEQNSYAQRMVSLLFLRIRQVMQIQDRTQKLIGACELISAVNSLAVLNVKYASRFVSLLRSLV